MRRFYFRAFAKLFFLTLVGLATSSLVLAAPAKQIRDWSVSCKADLTCSVSSNPESGGVWVFGFERGPEANAQLKFFISTDLKLKTGTEILAAVEGAENDETFILKNPQLKGQSLYETDLIASDFALIEAMRKGSKLLLNIQTTGGEAEVVVSLSGSGAAFLFLDEAQQRLEKADALIAKGDGAASQAKSREKVVDSDANLPKEVFSVWQNRNTDCGAEGQDLTASYGGTEVKLDDGAVLYLLPCGLPGAYNLVSSVFLYDPDEKKVRALGLPVMAERGPIVLDSVYNVSWDDAANSLSSFYKGRGLGDCGEASKWKLTGEDFYAGFELVEQRSKDDCDGQNDDWPIVWPVKK